MRTLVIYTSQTGFTKKYAELLTDKVQADMLSLREVKNLKDDFFETYDNIVYGGWLMAGNVSGAKWFVGKAGEWKDKRLAVFAVGGSPANSPDIPQVFENMLNEEQRKSIRTFYCPGGIDYSKMKAFSRFTMKLLVSMLKKKKDATEKDKAMLAMIDHSYDISNDKYIEPIAAFIGEKDDIDMI